jgi:hypothetical protein
VRHAYASALDLPETHDPAALKSDCELKAQYDALPAQEKEKFGYERALRNCIDSLVRQREGRVGRIRKGAGRRGGGLCGRPERHGRP